MHNGTLIKRGRPREFDINEAVDKAMYVFWEKGYDGTTIPDLTAAIGINRPSLYAAFGSKEGIFQKVLDHYRSGPASYVNRAIEKETAKDVFRSLLTGVIDLVTDTKNPGGCLFVGAALAAGNGSENQQTELCKLRLNGEEDIRKRFKKAQMEKDIPDNLDVNALAKMAATYMWGISVQATNGSSRKELLAMAELAARSFDDICKK